jgi:hypothetical protein
LNGQVLPSRLLNGVTGSKELIKSPLTFTAKRDGSSSWGEF